MNRFEIRNILAAHKEHFRVLPTLAMVELNGIIAAVNAEEEAAKLPPILPVEKIEQVKETPSKAKKKSKRKGK